MSFAIQIGFWAGIFTKLKEEHHSFDTQPSKEGVSVIICGKNEATNIIKYLPSILSQIYPVFEVIFVNDHSTDQTEVILSSLQLKHPHLKIVHLEGDLPGKKKAILTGIKKASYDILVFTDADCKPNSGNWIQELIRPLKDDKQISLGFAPFFPVNKFINRFARYDGALIFLLYGSLTKIGIPYMGVGRNLAYRKSVFSEASFSKHKDLLSGDDDLLINMQATAQNTDVVLNPSSLVYSQSESSFISFIRQKRRHVSVAWRYNLKHQLILALFAGSHWFFYVGAIAYAGWNWWIMLVLFLIKSFFVLQCMRRLFSISSYHDLLKWTIFLDLVYLIYYPLVAMLLYLQPPKKWK